MLDNDCALGVSFLLASFPGDLKEPLLAILLLVFTGVTEVAVVALEVAFISVRKLNGDEFVEGVVLNPVNDPNGLLLTVS